ncbi:hypothetical protein Y032_0106g3741 [Ancylostoma ceylanicum]|uniref:Sulfatase N-terminal domain-containing protein n=1 Tax=Ancylostoma ceylanicum TaxID=53326 RepID=A0A016TFS8_9BILA|nr:hypothetical protein Y032_0106g3741 [Ancylostoma ceylanicum]
MKRLLLCALMGIVHSCERPPSPSHPNIVLLVVDDMGFGDVASYGHPTQEYTSIDRMAHEGTRFTQAYSADSLCSPSRSGFMTGRLPIRLGTVGGKRIFQPYDVGGLPKNETTMAEMLKQAGYVTGMVGKWHLGINAHNRTDGSHLPSKRGFDFVGLNLPFTNAWECDTTGEYYKNGPDPSRCFLYDGDEIVQQPIRFQWMTENLVHDWRRFLQERLQKDQKKTPFFFYFSFPQVHSTQFANPSFLGSSVRGMYGDSINEMSWAIGEVLDSLLKAGIAENTLVIFMSDHGPHAELCLNGGSTAGLKGGKSNSYEGGFRIPFIAWQPGTVKAGRVSHEVISSMDLYRTFRDMQNCPQQRGDLPTRNQHSVEATTVFGWNKHTGGTVRNIMSCIGKTFKIHYKTSPIFLNDTVDPNLSYFCPNGKPRADWYVSASCPDEHLTTHDPPSVFDLAKDPYERYALEESDFVKQMRSQGANIVKEHRQTLVPVPIQMGHFDKNVVPCCDPPACRCDKITRREKANEEPSLHYPSVYKFFEGIGGIKGGI